MEVKLADPDYPILDLLRERWSPVAFDDRPVEREKLLQLFEAARWAASSFNEQPWRFLVATKDNPEEFEKMLSCLTEGNRKWAETAPVLAISLASMRFQHNDKPNHHAFHDVGLAVANLTLQATALDLYVHQMAGIHADRIREVYSVPEGFDPVAGIAIGYPGKGEELPEKVRARDEKPRRRNSLSEFVFAGRFGQPAALVKPDKK